MPLYRALAPSLLVSACAWRALGISLRLAHPQRIHYKGALAHGHT